MKAWPRITTLAVRLVLSPRIGLSLAFRRPCGSAGHRGEAWLKKGLLCSQQRCPSSPTRDVGIEMEEATMDRVVIGAGSGRSSPPPRLASSSVNSRCAPWHRDNRLPRRRARGVNVERPTERTTLTPTSAGAPLKAPGHDSLTTRRDSREP